ncbi:tRNA (adenosine(37)-N6)-threonylcarbamoyltransferase complex dimerization subunit type 1 TsaB [Elioraea sp.]|uniref:tRNA (adenosine(37)-N6)-threonylcarbamoyltransferase complex dimerization subunit type 1 TsaB n=1 Tax=Elioraea sp. TaxID=2185103 RepID=UPI0025BC4F3E|nr:tRNA (adenosine(37)-N6)-threonylcarbamoyltransferase complex dimerization subunit type 1 TsaB [Elioraea sp.]
MLLLCLDASLARSSAALWRGGALLAEAEAAGGTGQAAAIAVLAERVLAEAGIVASSLGLVAATVGPGGFSGIRAGLALAHGLAAGAGAALVGVTTAEALAAPHLGAHPVAALMDSRRGHRFVQVFAPGPGAPREIGPAQALAPEAIAAYLPAGAVTVGDAPEAMVRALPHARDLGQIALARHAGTLPALAPLPLYLDAPAARLASGLRPPPLP